MKINEDRYYERRYHATWMGKNGLSPLARLGSWMGQHPTGSLAAAPLDLLVAAAADVAARLPVVAAREPTRRHRKHFAWLLGWHLRLSAALVDRDDRHALGQIDDDGNWDPVFRRYRYVCRCGRAGTWRDSSVLARGEHDVHRTAAKEDA